MSEDTQRNKNSFSADTSKTVITGLLVFISILLVFGAGIWVGGKKAQFSYRWADNYHKNFAGPREGFRGDWRMSRRNDFIDGHGSFGEIIELSDPGFVIMGRGDVEKMIITTEDTVVKKGKDTSEEGLKVGDSVVVIGSPNEDGQIEAKLIRVFEGEFSTGKIKGPHTLFRSPFVR